MKFTKKLYEEHYDFNMSTFRKLMDATEADVDEENACLAKGMDLISQKDKILVLNDKHRWEYAKAYSKNPIPDDSGDEKKVPLQHVGSQTMVDHHLTMVDHGH